MFAALTALLVVIGIVVGGLLNNWIIGLVVMLIISVGINVFSYFFSKKFALMANKVHLVTREQEPRLYRIVENLAMQAGLPMPEVGVSDMPMPNAFATGRNPKNAAVVATRQILNLLNDDELEGVMAHELSHVKNRDILVMSVASTMASVVAYVTRMAVWAALLNNDENNGGNLIIAIIADITLPIAAMLIQLGVSRNREYLADESGARLTGRPMALASALTKLESGCSAKTNTYDNPSTANMWISNPFGQRRTRGLVNLFRTHPSTPDRIERLKKLDEEINGIHHF
ncbi:MAG TPA: zinc metalloprotease HtpX [Euryarchaeota archaeon]|nr:zinc metalloprotease HtpX [Euryarchaeota archaeon]